MLWRPLIEEEYKFFSSLAMAISALRESQSISSKTLLLFTLPYRLRQQWIWSGLIAAFTESERMTCWRQNNCFSNFQMILRSKPRSLGQFYVAVIRRFNFH